MLDGKECLKGKEGCMNKVPAFQFYPGDYLSSQRVSLMTLEEEGAYIRLLCYCWKHGHIPSDPVQLAHLIGKGASVALATKVSKMFTDKGGSRLVHDKLETLRIERNRWVEKSRQGGLKSAANRRMLKESEDQYNHPANHPTNGGTEMVDDCLQPKANTSSSSSIVTHTQGEQPSKSEVLAYAQMIGLTEWKAEDWWMDMETKGWKMGNTEVRNWQAGLQRVKAWWESDGRPMERPGKNGVLGGSTSMPLWKRIAVITQQFDTHPGNQESTYYKQGDKKAKADFIQLRKSLKALKEEEREAAMT